MDARRRTPHIRAYFTALLKTTYYFIKVGVDVRCTMYPPDPSPRQRPPAPFSPVRTERSRSEFGWSTMVQSNVMSGHAMGCWRSRVVDNELFRSRHDLVTISSRIGHRTRATHARALLCRSPDRRVRGGGGARGRGHGGGDHSERHCPVVCEMDEINRAGSEMRTEIDEIDTVLAALRRVRIKSHKPICRKQAGLLLGFQRMPRLPKLRPASATQ